MKLNDIVNKIETLFPLEDRMFDFDNVGLQVGDIDRSINKVLLSLDMTPELLNEAMGNNVDLIIVHHPFIFKGLRNVKNGDYFGSVITNLIKNDIALYVIHTNYDSNEIGMNYQLLKHLGVENILFVENSALAYGKLENELTHDEFTKLLKEKYKLNALKFSGKESVMISKIGVLGGSGINETNMQEAHEYGLDAYVSGDMTYKDGLFAKTLSLNVYDVGHYTENIGFKYLKDMLNNELSSVEFIYSELLNPHFDVK